VRDTARYVQHWDSHPQFVFLNLMGTHLPYAPPKKFIQSFAPVVLDEPEAQDFIQTYNTQALHWLLPLERPYPALETQTLNDMYDAEVAHQDHLLHQLLSTLDQPEHRANTLVIIVGDHGEMLGEHQIMGHGIGVHQELVHVPMMIRFPGQETGQRVKKAVSTTHIFHTVLNVAGIDLGDGLDGAISEFNLKNPIALPEIVFSEAYTPVTLLKIIQKYAPGLMNSFQAASPRWAVYNNPYKLIRTENAYDNLFNYLEDPQEKDHLTSQADCMRKMGTELEAFLIAAKYKSRGRLRGSATNMEDEQVLQRLRSLGYIE
jgi:arylsulfatase A-like enzyme